MSEIKTEAYASIKISKKKSIWIIEDDPGIQFVFKEVLELRYQLRFFSLIGDFMKASTSTSEPKPDLAIIDLRLPDGNFLDYLKEYVVYKIPYMIVSSIDDLDILRTCFNYGALDYLTKPFTKNEIIAKIERMLEKLNPQGHELSNSSIGLDPLRLEVSTRQGRVRLTVKEFRIINCLFKSSETPVSRQDLLMEVWQNQNVGEKTLDVHILNTRRKLAKIDLHIHFITNNGFVLSDKKEPKVVLSQNFETTLSL